jgi:hypothetical protein
LGLKGKVRRIENVKLKRLVADLSHNKTYFIKKALKPSGKRILIDELCDHCRASEVAKISIN